jgi:hypothetical protein
MRNTFLPVLVKLTSYGWMAALAGIALVGYLGYLQYQASDDHAYVVRDKLQVIAGKVESAALVTVTKKSRHSRERVSERYYEVSVKPSVGDVQKLRLALSVGRSNVQNIIDEPITALFDTEDDNFVYDVQMNGKTVLAYETTKASLLAQAQGKANQMVTPPAFIFALVLLFVGAVATFFNRKLRRQVPANA